VSEKRERQEVASLDDDHHQRDHLAER
jgi:hypothetical protein